MNKVQKAEAVKNAVNVFDDADFVSIISENEVAIRNLKNGSVWIAGYYFENDEVIFNTSNSEVIEEEEEFQLDTNDRSSFVETLTNMFKADGAVFTEGESNEELKSAVSGYNFKRKAEPVVAQSSPQSESLRGLLEDETLEIVDSIAAKYLTKLDTFIETKNQFLSNGQLFDEDGIKVSESIINPYAVIKLYQQKQELKNIISEGAEIIEAFYEDLSDNLDEEKIALLQGIHFEDKESAATRITKAFITSGYSAIDARAAVKYFNEAYDNHIAENKELFDEMHGLNKAFPLNAVGDEKGLRFLKFGQGIFDRNDVVELLEDFDRVIAKLPTSEAGRFHEIVGMRNIIDTMLVTNTIDDEVISEVISTFNSRFTNVQNGSPIPSDGHLKPVPSYHGIPRSPAEGK